MTITRMVRAALGVAAMLVLAGCMVGPSEQRSVAVRTSGVEGSWIDDNGNRSSFAGGRFQTVAADTGATLSDGSYRYLDTRTVTMEVRSRIRQTTLNVNCAQVTPSQLNCTSSAGNQFVLRRPPGTA